MGCKTAKNFLFMKTIKFIQVAASLGIAVPACLIILAQKSEASIAKVKLPQLKIELGLEHSNPVKEKITKLLNIDIDDSTYQQLAHTDVHANYTVSHTNVHSNYYVNDYHTDSHSNTNAYHCDTHSDSPV